MEDSVNAPDDGTQKNPDSDVECDAVDLADEKEKEADPDYNPLTDNGDIVNVCGGAPAKRRRRRPRVIDHDCSEDCPRSSKHLWHRRCHYCGCLTGDLRKHVRAAHPTEDYDRRKFVKNGKARYCPFCGKLCSCLIQHLRMVHRKESTAASVLDDTFSKPRVVMATNFSGSGKDSSELFEVHVVQNLDLLYNHKCHRALARVCRTDEMMMLIGRNLFANVMVNSRLAPLTLQAARVRSQMLRLAKLLVYFRKVVEKQKDGSTPSTGSEVLENQKDAVAVLRTPCTRSKVRENQKIMVSHTLSAGTEVLESQKDVVMVPCIPSPVSEILERQKDLPSAGSEQENQKDVVMVPHTPSPGSEILERQKDLLSAGLEQENQKDVEPHTPSTGSDVFENQNYVPSTGLELENQNHVVVEPVTPSAASEVLENQKSADTPSTVSEMQPSVIDMFKARNFPAIMEAYKQYTCWVDGDGNVRSRNHTQYYMYHLMGRAATILRVHFSAEGDLVTATDIAEFQKLMDDNRHLGGERNPKLNLSSKIKRVTRGKREKDAIKLRTYTVNRISSLTEDFTSSEYDELRDLCCSHLTLINARRGGTPAELRLSEWTEACSHSEQCESRMTGLSSMEKEAYHNSITIPQMGKDHVTVSIVVPANIVEAVRKLADPDIRRVSNVHPVNPYLFPSTLQLEGHITGFDAVISTCEKVDVRWVTTVTLLQHVVTAYTGLDLLEARRPAFYEEMERTEAFERLDVRALMKDHKRSGEWMYILDIQFVSFSMSYFGDSGFPVCIGDKSTVSLQTKICTGFFAPECSLGITGRKNQG